MNHWWHFLLGAKFEVLSDHQALSWMFGQAEPPKGRDESGWPGKTTRQLALLDHMGIDENGKLYHTH